jgi:ADP-ribose pyrophosphatase YjhB (NUDIX family)
MRQTTLCFLLKDDRVLLGMKKRGFGVGKWNGMGGKLIEGETAVQNVIRELNEEIGVELTARDLKEVAVLEFNFDGKPDWDQVCHVFTVSRWFGAPSESEEMRPQWHAMSALPFNEMWVDDPRWLPLVLAGKKIKGEFLFDETGKAILEYKVVEIK